MAISIVTEGHNVEIAAKRFTEKSLRVLEEHSNNEEVISFSIKLGNHSVCISMPNCGGVSDLVTSAFHQADYEKEEVWKISVVDLSRGYKIPPIDWNPQMHMPTGQLRTNRAKSRIAFDPITGITWVMVKENRNVIAFLPSLNAMPLWWISTPFRLGISWIANEYGFEFVHGAAIGRNGLGVILAGSSGVGKSTLSLSLGQLGWEFLSDDFFLMDGQRAHSVYRRVRLWEDSTKSLGFEPLREFMSPIKRLKFIFEYSNLKGIVPISTLSVRVLAFPQLTNFTHLKSLSPPKAFLDFTSATLSGLQGGSDESFSRMAKIVRNSSLYTFGVRGSTELISDSLTNALNSFEGSQ